MCHLVPPKSVYTVYVYLLSLFQAGSLYALAIYFDGWERLLEKRNESKEKKKMEQV